MYTYNFKVVNEDHLLTKLHSTTNVNEIGAKDVTSPYFVEVIKGNNFVKDLRNIDDLEEWATSRERAIWKESVKKFNPENKTTKQIFKDFVKPTHYQNYIDEYQWIDAMSRIPRFTEPIAFKAAIELQIRKYLDRNGRKDEELQELKKGLFYYMYLVMYLNNSCKPILSKDIHEIMEKFK